MTKKQISEWEAFFRVENEVPEEDKEAAEIAALNLPEHASAGLARMMTKRRAG